MNLSEFVPQDPFLQDLTLLFTGTERCAPEHRWGPGIREHFKLHWIISGTGRFHSEQGDFTLRQGQGFLIVPQQVVSYQADAETPWHYAWMGFQGASVQHWLDRAGLSSQTPVFETALEGPWATAFQELTTSRPMARRTPLLMTGLLYRALDGLLEELPAARLPKQEPVAELYVTEALRFVEANYCQPIKVEDVAAHVGLDRSYLGTLFRQKLGQPLQSYLLDYRMRRARALLEDPRWGVADVARSVGYRDPFLFSKMFRRTQGLSPRQFRAQLSADHPLDAGQILPATNAAQA